MFGFRNKIGGAKGVYLSEWNNFYRGFINVLDYRRCVDAVAYKSSGDFT